VGLHGSGERGGGLARLRPGSWRWATGARAREGEGARHGMRGGGGGAGAAQELSGAPADSLFLLLFDI
jgi:hypothetical protein